MSQQFRVGQKVRWKWSGNTAEGTIKETFKESVSRTIKGSKITRNATEDEPAYLIEQEDGDQVLKSASELETA